MNDTVSKTKYGIDMTSGNILRALIVFAVPVLLGDLLQQLYGIADSVIVGRNIGKIAFAAVGSTAYITNIMIGFFSGLSVGATAIVARRFGSRDREALERAVYTTIIMTFVVGLIMSAAGVVCSPLLLRLTKVSDEVYSEALVYLRIFFAGSLGLIMYNMLSGIMRAVGDSTRPLYFLAACTVLNLILDLLFVVAFRWGIAGAALATILSQFISCAVILAVISRPGEVCRVNWKLGRISKPELHGIVSIGMPMGVQKIITSISNVIVLSYVNCFGTDCTAGWSAYFKVESAIMAPIMSLTMAATTLVGQNLGAGNYPRIRDGVKKALLFSVAVTVCIVAPVCVFAGHFVSAFGNDPGMIEYGSLFIRQNAPWLLLGCFNNVFSGALRGKGDSRIPMYIMLFSFVLFRQLYLFFGTQVFTGIRFAVFSYPAGWIMCTLCLALYWVIKKPFNSLEKQRK